MFHNCDENFFNYTLFDWRTRQVRMSVEQEPCPWFIYDVWTGVYTWFFSPSDGTNAAYEMQMHGFSRRITIGAFNKLTIFLARYPAPDQPTRVALLSGPARNPKESFIDEIVNTADQWMFCLSRPDVYPSRSATTRCVSSSFPRSKKELDFVDNSLYLSLFLTVHLNELALSETRFFRHWNFLSPEFFVLVFLISDFILNRLFHFFLTISWKVWYIL